MRRKSSVNVLMLLLSLVGAAAAYGFGETLLSFVSYMPYFLQCGIYLAFMTGVVCLVMFISEKISSGSYRYRTSGEFSKNALKATAIFIPAAFILGMVTQLLYGLLGGSVGGYTPHFQGTYVVCDISGSMEYNDPDMEAVDGLLDYVDSVPLGEYLGIIVYADTPFIVNEYSELESEEQREALKDFIIDNVEYAGGTGTQDALLEAIDQMRSADLEDWPGLIILFSDGLSDLDYNALQRAAMGDLDNPKNMIPVNTVFFSTDLWGGYQMNTIAQKTGGTYFYLQTDAGDVTLNDAFTHSRTIFHVEKPHLLQMYVGTARSSVFRVILQIVLLTLWGALTAATVVTFLNNQKLTGRMSIRAGGSLLCALLFSLMLTLPRYDFGMPARAVLVLGFCLIFIPTYVWDAHVRQSAPPPPTMGWR